MNLLHLRNLSNYNIWKEQKLMRISSICNICGDLESEKCGTIGETESEALTKSIRPIQRKDVFDLMCYFLWPKWVGGVPPPCLWRYILPFGLGPHFMTGTLIFFFFILSLALSLIYQHPWILNDEDVLQTNCKHFFAYKL